MWTYFKRMRSNKTILLASWPYVCESNCISYVFIFWVQYVGVRIDFRNIAGVYYIFYNVFESHHVEVGKCCCYPVLCIVYSYGNVSLILTGSCILRVLWHILKCYYCSVVFISEVYHHIFTYSYTHTNLMYHLHTPK